MDAKAILAETPQWRMLADGTIEQNEGGRWQEAPHWTSKTSMPLLLAAGLKSLTERVEALEAGR